jgi:hypothetical protein
MILNARDSLPALAPKVAEGVGPFSDITHVMVEREKLATGS